MYIWIVRYYSKYVSDVTELESLCILNLTSLFTLSTTTYRVHTVLLQKTGFGTDHGKHNTTQHHVSVPSDAIQSLVGYTATNPHLWPKKSGECHIPFLSGFMLVSLPQGVLK
jgi:hypothetical protein